MNAGDWVKTKEGYRGKIVYISRLTAFVDIPDKEDMRVHPYLLSELIRVDPPESGPPENNLPSAH